MTSDDMELVEQAAKAACIKPLRWNTTYAGYETNEGLWNPLLNDGDALRVAVKLWFNIKLFNPADPLEDDYVSSSGMVEIWREDDDDPLVVEYFKTAAERLTATRRAIVRAAAAVGRSIL